MADFSPILPSADSANRLLNGEPGALPKVLLHLGGRALLISTGMYAAGVRNPKRLAMLSLAGSVAIETFVLMYLAVKRNSDSAQENFLFRGDHV